jgi:hypothetical protein
MRTGGGHWHPARRLLLLLRGVLLLKLTTCLRTRACRLLGGRGQACGARGDLIGGGAPAEGAGWEAVEGYERGEEGGDVRAVAGGGGDWVAAERQVREEGEEGEGRQVLECKRVLGEVEARKEQGWGEGEAHDRISRGVELVEAWEGAEVFEHLRQSGWRERVVGLAGRWVLLDRTSPSHYN